MDKRSRHLPAAVLLVALALAACGPLAGGSTGGDGDQVGGLAGTAWTLDTYLNSEGEVVSLLPETRQITAEFSAVEVSGDAGCNSYFGSYDADGGRMEIGPLAWTEMYCFPDELMAQESDYLTALQSAASYRIEGDVLELRDAGDRLVARYLAQEE
jgi:heat shock protein HslJ